MDFLADNPVIYTYPPAILNRGKNMNKKTAIITRLLLFIIMLSAASSFAAVSKFRKEFTEVYRMNKPDYLAMIVKRNKEIIPQEVRDILKEAAEGNLTYPEKMDLIDIAVTMASMHKHWHGEEALLKEAEAAQKAEMKKEADRIAEAEKWNKYEKTIGNFVMRTNEAAMSAKGQSPAIYPHWLHRMLFDCKVCHQEIFAMKRGGNNINHQNMAEGKLCAACHDGKLAFGADSECERCHVIGKPGEERLLNISKIDLGRIKDAASKAGGSFAPENLPNGKLPLDRLGSIDWTWMRNNKIYSPVETLTGEKEEIRDNSILFEPPMPYINNTLFNHNTHSAQNRCSACHNDIFKDSLGGNAVTMKDMGEGKFCGYCHGKVAFKLADCNRCHSKKPGEPAGNALKRAKNQG